MTAAIALLGLGVSLPFMGPTEENTRFQSIPISMSQAVEAAEMVIPGQAIDARLEIVEGSPVYAIHILSIDNSLSTVKVNGEDGEVTVVLDSDEQQQVDELIRSEQGGSI
ncbi:MAG TPA: PepSY domain-containing protein [Nitrospira sp.]|nr:PepSY domain-containing protein [Nitrospira sp.]